MRQKIINDKVVIEYESQEEMVQDIVNQVINALTQMTIDITIDTSSGKGQGVVKKKS